MNLIEILGLALKYGPAIIAALKALEPLFEAAMPVVKKMVEHGVDEADAWPVVIKHMDAVTEQQWFDRAMGDIQ